MRRGKTRTLESTPAVADLPPDVVERVQRRVDAIFAKVIGGVMLWIGLAFAGLFVWFSYKTLNRPPDIAVLLVLAVFAILAAFCSLVGWRLFSIVQIALVRFSLLLVGAYSAACSGSLRQLP